MGYHTELPKPYHLVPLSPSPSSISAATLIARGHRIKLAADLGLARALLLRRRHRRRRRRRGVDAPLPKSYEAEIGCGGADDGERGKRRSRRRRRRRSGGEGECAAEAGPGGGRMGVETLFEETADYIEALQGQVSAMRALTSLLHGLERESSTSTSTSTTTMNTMDV